MLIISSFNVGKDEFCRHMNRDYHDSYSRSGLEYIYQDIEEREKEEQKQLIFKAVDIAIDYEEDCYQEFLNNANIDIDVFAHSDADLNLQLEQIISEHFEEDAPGKTFIAFTAEKTVVYKAYSVSGYVTI